MVTVLQDFDSSPRLLPAFHTVLLHLRARATALSLTAAIAAFVLLATSKLPVLRHDWVLPPIDVVAALGSAAGWSPDGIGSPVAYPTTYIIVPILAVIGQFAGAFAAHVVLMIAIAALIATGAYRLTRSRVQSGITSAAIATFALFNPWTYTELVAGHTFMLVSFGASLWFTAELLRGTDRTRVAALALVGIQPQIQFLCVALIPCLILAVRRRLLLPIVVWCALIAPAAIGISFARNSLVKIPRAVEWQSAQSVPFPDVLLLRGYFANYDSHFPTITIAALWLFFVVVLIGVRRSLTTLEGTAAIASGLLVCVFVLGFRGPMGALTRWSFVHVPAISLFRELYDLVAILAIVFMILATNACRNSVLRFALLPIALVLPLAWILSPPLGLAVDARTLPTSHEEIIPLSTRYALIPAFQPMRFRGLGSGIDPDATARRGNVTTINMFQPTYPVIAALGRYLERGDATMLEALGVSTIYARAHFATDIDSIRWQWADPTRVPAFLRNPSKIGTRRLHPAPEVSLLPGMPKIGSLISNVGAGNVLLVDAPAIAGDKERPLREKIAMPIVPVPSLDAGNDARRGWVDASFAFTQLPQAAQAYGGIFTVSRAAPLVLAGSRGALVWIDGSLNADDGRLIVRGRRTYEWVRFPSRSLKLFCRGACFVAAVGAPPSVPLDPPLRSSEALVFHSLAPWLCAARIPAGGVATLRYNSAFDEHWIVFSREFSARHFRVDGAVNGWLLPERHEASTAVIIQWVAALQSGTAIVSVVFVTVVLLVNRGRDSLRRR